MKVGLRLLAGTVGLLLAGTASAAVITPVDLNDFFADPEVTVAADGLSATFVESAFAANVLLSNDPGLGDPNVIIPLSGRSLLFDFDFTEAAGEVDSFLAFVLDASTGLTVGPAFEFSVLSSATGTVSFDLTGLVGTTIGLQFEMLSGDGGPPSAGASTLRVSQVRLSDPARAVPAPPTAFLVAPMLLGLLGASSRRRAEFRRKPATHAR